MPDTDAKILLTGASQGIGKAIAVALAKDQHAVVGISRSRPNPADFGSSRYFCWQGVDLSNGTEIEKFVASVDSVAFRALILSAVDYGDGARHPASAITAEEWHRIVGTTCVGQSLLTSLFLPKLMANPHGIIVNISSDVAILPSPGRAAYSASKAGLHAMLRAVAAENAVEKLRVYQLIPTFQSLTEGIRRRRPADFDFSSYADPAVIAAVVRQLVSSSASTPPGSYLVHRDGTLHPFSEITRI